MPLSLQDALNAYGFVGKLANSIPDLRGILDQAIANEWQPAAFERALNDSAWWQQNSDAVRQYTILNATDPATFHQNRHNAAVKIQMMAQQMGRNPGSWDQTLAMADRALMGNWDDEQLGRILAESTGLGVGAEGNLSADAAQLENHLREVAGSYGIAYTDDGLRGFIGSIQSGHQTVDTWDSLMRARAKAQFPHLASQIDAGMTVRDIADPYIATYAQTLELPETEIKLTDPRVQKALNLRQPDGSAASQPMWQFQRELKDDPRWDKTNNAKTEAYSVVQQLGKDFGFLS